MLLKYGTGGGWQNAFKLPNDPSSGDSFVSLDGDGYPIITWSSESGGGIRASYCSDLTDIDNDGLLHLYERAFNTNPYVADASLHPKTSVITIGTDHYLSLDFPLNLFGHGPTPPITIDSSGSAVNTVSFRYEIFRSNNLQDWSNDNIGLYQLSSQASEYEFEGPLVTFRTYSTIPLVNPNSPSEFLSIVVTRL